MVRPNNLLSLRQTIGNKAVLRLLDDASQRQSQHGEDLPAKKGTVTGVVQRLKGNIPYYAADKAHNSLKRKISAAKKSLKSRIQAYYDHNANRIDLLAQKVAALGN